jgi:hypothetical protein
VLKPFPWLASLAARRLMIVIEADTTPTTTTATTPSSLAADDRAGDFVRVPWALTPMVRPPSKARKMLRAR